MRDCEQLYRRQLELIARETDPPLPHESTEVLPQENNYREASLRRLLGEYEEVREDTFWLLRMLDEDDWNRGGIHPYRGRITVTDIAREMHEYDLEYLYEAQRLRRAMPRGRGSGARGRGMARRTTGGSADHSASVTRRTNREAGRALTSPQPLSFRGESQKLHRGARRCALRFAACSARLTPMHSQRQGARVCPRAGQRWP